MQLRELRWTWDLGQTWINGAGGEYRRSKRRFALSVAWAHRSDWPRLAGRFQGGAFFEAA